MLFEKPLTSEQGTIVWRVTHKDVWSIFLPCELTTWCGSTYTSKYGKWLRGRPCDILSSKQMAQTVNALAVQKKLGLCWPGWLRQQGGGVLELKYRIPFRKYWGSGGFSTWGQAGGREEHTAWTKAWWWNVLFLLRQWLRQSRCNTKDVRMSR